MTAARALGMERAEAARFSLLLAIPAILGASLLEGYELYKLGNLQLGVEAGLAAVLAFVSAVLAIAVMMVWLKRSSFTSLDTLRERVLAFIEYFNRVLAKPFRWTYTGRPLQA